MVHLPLLLALTKSRGCLSFAFTSTRMTSGIRIHDIQKSEHHRLFSRHYMAASSNDVSSPEVPPVEISPSTHGTLPLTGNSFVQSNETMNEKLSAVLKQEGWTRPTTIQANAIPLLRKEFDVMASSQTGSGKSLMFSLPMVERIVLESSNTKNNRVMGMVISPTRELAIQTAGVLKTLTKNYPHLKVSLATGGGNTKQQRQELASASIVVGTPGRILQFTDERNLSLQNLKFLVIDEADRLMDLGFEPQLTRIARLLKTKRQHQSVLCSATFPTSVQRIAADFLRPEYYFVSVGRVGSTHARIKQRFEWMGNDAGKVKAVTRHVTQFLKRSNGNKNNSIIVFANMKQDVDQYGKALASSGIKCRIIHGDKEQSDRNQALRDFSNKKAQVLVATDVAARGLDVSHIGLVIQADAPSNVDSYTHRVGRTGRAGAKGEAVTFLNNKNLRVAGELLELLYEADQPVPAWLVGMAYSSKAHAMQEEAQISAGTLTESEKEEQENVVNDEFSGQDFRRHAVEGSYGAGRDTSYRSFDDEAYSPSVQVDLVGDQSPIPKAENSFSTEMDTSGDTDTVAPSVSMPKLIESKPSRQLAEALEEMNQGKGFGSKPDAKIYTTLSRNRNQKLPFEYLGNFPFDEVLPLLRSTKRDYRNTAHSSLPRILMVAEKPSIALAIAEALSGKRGPRKRFGISRALPVYEFVSEAFEPLNESGSPTKCLVTVTSVVGHLFSLGFDSKDQRQSDPSDFFRLPIVKQEESTTSKLRVMDHLRALAADSDHLVLWLDCDPEGENIAHEVIAVTRRAIEAKEGGAADRIHRAKFSAITAKALQDAFKTLQKPDADLSRSVDARQELDLRIGVALTRLLTWKCVGAARKRFSPATKFVSYGPCQTPALSFCVDRAHEIQKFAPTTFWELQIEASPDSDKKNNRPLKWTGSNGSAEMGDNSTPNKVTAEKLVKIASKSGAHVVVESIREENCKVSAPVGLNTVALLEAGSKALGMSPKKVMSVAEKLYSDGYISYPRTETTRYDPTGFDVRTTLRQHSKHGEWGKSVSYLLRTKYSNHGSPPTRGRDVGDHPPITPLKAASRQEIGNGPPWRIYEFIVRTFLGSLHNDLHYLRTVASLKLVGEGSADQESGADFELEVVTVDSLGFADVCRWVLRDIGASREQSEMSELSIGQELSITKAAVRERETRPPRFLQEHELIRLMDENRIGTDAIMAVHVNNIIDRGYVILCDEAGVPLRAPRPPRPGSKPLPRQIGRYMVPTALGLNLIALFGNETNEATPALLVKPSIRQKMEEEVKQIALGVFEKDECVQTNLDWFESRYQEFFESLSRDRVNEFARELSPTSKSLENWRKTGVFEPKQTVAIKKSTKPKPRNTQQGKNSNKQGGNKKKNRGAWKSRSRQTAKK
ncbi:unnamed protein product [Cylindrotheca closterium]|uniref:DNA topoisomerase n=1 Tax=Cylindrotheca closterium TaxID=2856 RepID=A0AAD2FMU4_9STRA|nr:unnamed protein product [Cylindrotheca closterium]